MKALSQKFSACQKGTCQCFPKIALHPMRLQAFGWVAIAASNGLPTYVSLESPSLLSLCSRCLFQTRVRLRICLKIRALLGLLWETCMLKQGTTLESKTTSPSSPQQRWNKMKLGTAMMRGAFQIYVSDKPAQTMQMGLGPMWKRSCQGQVNLTEQLPTIGPSLYVAPALAHCRLPGNGKNKHTHVYCRECVSLGFCHFWNY